MKRMRLAPAFAITGWPLLWAGNISTGLTGVVLRGPVMPVCQVNVPCDAPFSASFTVQQSTVVVGRFHSDDQGHFEVRLPPGTYRIIPGPDAPIISPGSQEQQVGVRPDPL